MNDGAALRVLSFLNDSNQQHVASLANEKRKVTVIGEENEPDEFEEPPPPPVVIEEEIIPSLDPEKVKEFFKATENGSVERLDELFESIGSDADPNMTQFAENLLMTAIRAKRTQVAEYLIDQLAINVNYAAELVEFRTRSKFPIRYRTMSCRQLAYDKGLMDLVDLIDLTSDEVRPSIKRYVQRRLQARLDAIHRAYLKRIKEQETRLLVLQQQQQEENKLLEEVDENEENDLPPTEDTVVLPPPIVATVRRPYKSHIQETMKSIESKQEKSIEETGKKTFHFSTYTLRFRLVDTGVKGKPKVSKKSEITPAFLPFVRSDIQPALSRVATSVSHRSVSEASIGPPVRENRTSISRSARQPTTTSHILQTMPGETKSEVQPSTTPISPTRRLLPKRATQSAFIHGYIPQQQHALYNEPHLLMPVTLKSTAVGLRSSARVIRD